MSFYTDVFIRGDSVYYRGIDSAGKRVQCKHAYKPYLFVFKDDGEYKTVDGKPVDKIKFESIYAAKDFIKKYSDVGDMPIYGMTNFQYAFIRDVFPDEVEFDTSLISVASLDIETMADTGFPDVKLADKEITAITLRKDNTAYVFGCGSFETTDSSIHYCRCSDERVLLEQFISTWCSLDLDVVTGWNIEFFDIPYLVNRIKRVLGEHYIKQMSPWGIIDEKTVEFRNQVEQSYDIRGIAVLDYLKLYRKFTFTNHESYRLDFIAQQELGEKKVDYSEYGTIDGLYKNNYQLFIEYNIHDTVLIDKFEDKLGFVELVMTMAYDAKVNYVDVMGTVRPWDVIIHDYLMSQKVVVSPMPRQSAYGSRISGGFVKEPLVGMSKWVVSFDLTSLYPHIIMGYNISPDTFMTKSPIEYELSDNSLTMIGEVAGHLAVAGNGCVYRTDKLGFMPALMKSKFDSRSVNKKLMIQAKHEVERLEHEIKLLHTPQEFVDHTAKRGELVLLLREAKKNVSRYDKRQHAKKIQLNSLYGALANQYFRWFSLYNAEAITTTGQLIIKYIDKKFNAYLNAFLGTVAIDYVIASDTDSVYVCLEALVNKICPDITDPKRISEILDEFCKNIIQPLLNEWFTEFSLVTRAYEQKLSMKRESICEKMIIRGKKMYIKNSWNDEGIAYDEPKLKMTGIEAVRSSTPRACRENIKKALGIVMNGTETELRQFVKDFRASFIGMPFEDIASPRSISGLHKYKGTEQELYKSGTPIQVKGAILFNNLLGVHSINTVPPIQDGDKIRFSYLKMPNPLGDSVISCPGVLPTEFGLDKYIDREKQFDKAFLEPIKSITDVIGWQTEHKSTLESFFL